MGNGPSNNRRNGRIQQNPVASPPPPRMIQPPAGYPGNHAPYPGPAIYPSNGQHHLSYFNSAYYNGGMTAPMGPPQFYQQGHLNGQYMMNLQPGFRPVAPCPGPSPHTPPPVAEAQKTNTIRNEVNLKKASLRLEKDEENPGFYLVAFTFDANVAGSISIFFVAKEKDKCGFTPVKPHLFRVTRVPFEKGYGQKFKQAPGSGVNLALFDEKDLNREGEDGVYPLVIRTETVSKDPTTSAAMQEEAAIGAPLPESIHCQTTMAVIEKKEDGSPKIRVTRQTIWVDGKMYEIQEIYGIENSGGAGGGFDSNDSGKECVICMSEPRDTTVLPCRHMCMCLDCAKKLRFQTNRCPICRTPVERLLEIKVPRTDNYDNSMVDSYGANGSQSSDYSRGG